MDLQLTGKVAVVTGASKGIGLAVAETLLAEGARVVTASRSAADPLHAGGDHVHVVADLATPDGPAEVVARAAEAFGGVDVLVNNVGFVAPSGGFLATDDDAWHANLDVNFFSFLRTTRAALPLLLEGGGSIVNISSINARMPFHVAPHYAAAKAAMTNVGKSLSEEFAPQGVRVNTVSPGPVDTPLWQVDGGMGEMLAGVAGVEREAVMTAVLPSMLSLATGRVAEAEEVAWLVAFLASPRSASTTGSDFVIDSGALKAV
jgi:NAD(P)-dependent dehydrogenase (short-subunit alcohol dehydrogenase family)